MQMTVLCSRVACGNCTDMYFRFLSLNDSSVPQIGDSFGLQFVKATALKKFTITSSKSLAHLENKFTVLVSDATGTEWTACRHSTRFPFIHTMVLDITCPSSLSQSSSRSLQQGLIENVRIQFDQNLEKSLEVCGMEVGGMVL